MKDQKTDRSDRGKGVTGVRGGANVVDDGGGGCSFSQREFEIWIWSRGKKERERKRIFGETFESDLILLDSHLESGCAGFFNGELNWEEEIHFFSLFSPF